ncbi:hypothetical protein CHCC14598_1412 [Bacillus licheniformis]|nr:hypothetical protein CHCC20339_0663 [Bacillus licheniformis]TWM93921.1 hypothetical protein CHCC14598_1412 [Bacillus licheniformis]
MIEARTFLIFTFIGPEEAEASLFETPTSVISFPFSNLKTSPGFSSDIDDELFL